MNVMIAQPKLSTIDTPTRYGGLLICGMNYGLHRGGTAQTEDDFPPWAQYFTHESNRTNDKFVSRLALWFDWWGIPLEVNGTPTELNCSISQTNLFYDSSRSFASPSTEEIQLAFKRLDATIARLNISGLLLASITMVEATRNHLRIGEWKTTTAGRFSLRQALAGSLRVTVCPHPRSPQSRCDVESHAEEMRKWVKRSVKGMEGKTGGTKECRRRAARARLTFAVRYHEKPPHDGLKLKSGWITKGGVK